MDCKLNKRAQKWIKENCKTKIIEVYVDGVKDEERSSYEFYHVDGKYELSHPFDRMRVMPGFELKNGKAVYTREQVCIETKNVVFVCVTDEDGNDIPELMWTEEEIREYIPE